MDLVAVAIRSGTDPRMHPYRTQTYRMLFAGDATIHPPLTTLLTD